MRFLRPDRFPDDPLGWAGNQSGHFCAGLAMTFYGSVAAFMANGEFPYRWKVWLIVATLYLLFELVSQGWAGWDTVEDWTFASLYGSAAPLILFHEVAAGRPDVTVDLMAALPLVIVLKCHVIFGVLVRQ